jgi:hypothetical protein
VAGSRQIMKRGAAHRTQSHHDRMELSHDLPVVYACLIESRGQVSSRRIRRRG